MPCEATDAFFVEVARALPHSAEPQAFCPTYHNAVYQEMPQSPSLRRPGKPEAGSAARQCVRPVQANSSASVPLRLDRGRVDHGVPASKAPAFGLMRLRSSRLRRGPLATAFGQPAVKVCRAHFATPFAKRGWLDHQAGARTPPRLVSVLGMPRAACLATRPSAVVGCGQTCSRESSPSSWVVEPLQS